MPYDQDNPLYRLSEQDFEEIGKASTSCTRR
jgi:hypothetical protein